MSPLSQKLSELSRLSNDLPEIKVLMAYTLAININTGLHHIRVIS
jgi:hypothetical protein